MSILLASSLFALLSALGGDFVGAIAGLVVAGAGAMEVHGGTLLHHYDARGANWLVSSQLVCLVGILAYCAVRLIFVQIPPIPPSMKPLIDMNAQQYGVSTDRFLLKIYQVTFLLLAVLSVLYQGRVAIFYARHRRAVTQAVHSDE